jgi:transposase
MPTSRPTYTKAFREQIVALHRSGRTVRELAVEFPPSEWTIRSWIRKAKQSGGDPSPDGLKPSEREELRRLRRENRRLKLEREILSKAAAWFAQETKGLPPSSDL